MFSLMYDMYERKEREREREGGRRRVREREREREKERECGDQKNGQKVERKGRKSRMFRNCNKI